MCALRKCPARCRTLWGCVPSPSLLRRTRSAVQRRSPWQRDGVGWGARCPQIQWFYHHFTVPVTRNMAITGGHTPLFRHSNIFIGIFHVSHMVGLDICVYKHVNRYKHKIYAYDVDALHVLFAIYIAYTYMYIYIYTTIFRCRCSMSTKKKQGYIQYRFYNYIRLRPGNQT